MTQAQCDLRTVLFSCPFCKQEVRIHGIFERPLRRWHADLRPADRRRKGERLPGGQRRWWCLCAKSRCGQSAEPGGNSNRPAGRRQ
nr:MAG TPA: Transcription elongation factor Elf1 like [Caudoviricetes sp.]